MVDNRSQQPYQYPNQQPPGSGGGWPPPGSGGGWPPPAPQQYQPPAQTPQPYQPQPYQQQPSPPYYQQPAMPYALPSAKKRHTGRIIGIVVAGALILAAVAVFGYYIIRSMVGAGSAGTKGDVYTTSDGTYVNKLVGVSFKVPPGWSIGENKYYPDEQIAIFDPLSPSRALVWIDRYPDYSTADFLYENPSVLKSYADTLDTGRPATQVNSSDATIEISRIEDYEANGIKWMHVVFTIEIYGEKANVDLYLADMPDGRGLMMYAVVSQYTSGGGYDAEERLVGISILDSFEFVGPK